MEPNSSTADMESAPANLAKESWVTLTDLGRRFGISAVHCGRHLSQAGLRDNDGFPLPGAISNGYAYRRPERNANRSVLWHRDRCTEVLCQHGLQTMDEQHLVEQWADLLEALAEGSPAILSTPDEMAASELPYHLLGRVNQRLAARGSSLRINQAARSHAPSAAVHSGPSR